METGIERAPTIEERKDFKQIGEETSREKFLRVLAEVEMKFIKQHLPFDSQCAKLDFVDEAERIERESVRMYGYVRIEDIEKLRFDGLEKYGKEERFEMVGDDEDVEMQNINNVKTAVKTGHTIKYRCKRGHGVSVFLPMDIYEERFGKKGGK